MAEKKSTEVSTMKTSTVKNMHERDDVNLEDEVSSKKRSVLWFVSAFVIIVAFFIVAFFLMNILQFPFSIGSGGPTGPTGAGGAGGPS